jgi:hypothetical protein
LSRWKQFSMRSRSTLSTSSRVLSTMKRCRCRQPRNGKQAT